MQRSIQFNVRLSAEERKRLEELAQWFERNQGDTLRVLIRQAHTHYIGNAGRVSADPSPPVQAMAAAG